MALSGTLWDGGALAVVRAGKRGEYGCALHYLPLMPWSLGTREHRGSLGEREGGRREPGGGQGGAATVVCSAALLPLLKRLPGARHIARKKFKFEFSKYFWWFNSTEDKDSRHILVVQSGVGLLVIFQMVKGCPV